MNFLGFQKDSKALHVFQKRCDNQRETRSQAAFLQGILGGMGEPQKIHKLKFQGIIFGERPCGRKTSQMEKSPRKTQTASKGKDPGLRSKIMASSQVWRKKDPSSGADFLLPTMQTDIDRTFTNKPQSKYRFLSCDLAREYGGLPIIEGMALNVQLGPGIFWCRGDWHRPKYDHGCLMATMVIPCKLC